MQPNQDQIFATSEGDRWFERNKGALQRFDPETDLPLQLMKLYGLRPRSVLEVGAANGYRLAAISDRSGTRVVAVEPSTGAIRDGKARFPRVRFVQGIACQIPLQESFDLVIVNFVFHWIDRTNFLRSVAEIDRLLRDGGFLILGDFYPSNLVKIQYDHLSDQEVYTYKQNYAATFLASGLYHSVSLITRGHSSKALTGEATEYERTGTWLLRKMLNDHYFEGSFQRGG